MVAQEDLKLTSPVDTTKSTATYGTIPSEKDLNTRKTGLDQMTKDHIKAGRRGSDTILLKTPPLLQHPNIRRSLTNPNPLLED